MLAHAVAPGARYGPDALSPSPDARALAFVGPTEFTVSVVSAGSLDEVRAMLANYKHAKRMITMGELA